MKNVSHGLWRLGLVVCISATAAADEAAKIESVGLTLIDTAEVAAEDNGVIARRLVSEGRVVNVGDPLILLKDGEAKAELEKARIDAQAAKQRAENDVAVRLAEKQLALDQLERQRAEKSNRKFPNTVSASQMAQLQLKFDRSQLEVESQQHERALARLALTAAQSKLAAAAARFRKRQVRAPMSGTIVSVSKRAGEWVAAGEPVLRIVRVDRLRAEGYLRAGQNASELQGRKTTFQLALPGGKKQSYFGQVTFVSLEVNPVDQRIQVLAEIQNHDGNLRAGNLGTLWIHSKPADGLPATNIAPKK